MKYYKGKATLFLQLHVMQSMNPYDNDNHSDIFKISFTPNSSVKFKHKNIILFLQALLYWL